MFVRLQHQWIKNFSCLSPSGKGSWILQMFSAIVSSTYLSDHPSTSLRKWKMRSRPFYNNRSVLFIISRRSVNWRLEWIDIRPSSVVASVRNLVQLIAINRYITVWAPDSRPIFEFGVIKCNVKELSSFMICKATFDHTFLLIGPFFAIWEMWLCR